MKIFTAAQIRACDAYTIQASNILSIDLMERAAIKCFEWIKNNFESNTLFVVLCGTGNNGGDGLAITRLLHYSGFGVKAFVLNIGNNLSPDCNTNLQRLQRIDSELVTFIEPDTFFTDLPQDIIIIDAIFGTGLNRPISGWVESFIDQINRFTNIKVAIDIPSGMAADSIAESSAGILCVRDTLSFQFYKRSFLYNETAQITGNVHILDIGLDSTFINATHTLYKTIDRDTIKTIYKKRSQFTHKGTYGKTLIIGGSYGKIGAVTLSSKAAIKSGSGLVTALLPSCGYHILQTSVPEVMCRTSGDFNIEKIENADNANAIAIGPGLGTDEVTEKALIDFLETCIQPIVVDADALNIIAKNQFLLSKLPKNSVITPHPKEFIRLFGENSNSMLQTEHARMIAMRYGITIVLKNHYTTVTTPEGECYYNMNGNAGMATGGSGDVLTGIITSLIAQGYEPVNAALLGVYIHGMSGDFAAKELSEESMIAGDIIDSLCKCFLEIRNY